MALYPRTEAGHVTAAIEASSSSGAPAPHSVVAASMSGTGEVGTASLANGAIVASKMSGTGEVGSASIANAAITAAKMSGTGEVGSASLATGAVVAAAMSGTGEVGSASLAAGLALTGDVTIQAPADNTPAARLTAHSNSQSTLLELLGPAAALILKDITGASLCGTLGRDVGSGGLDLVAAAGSLLLRAGVSAGDLIMSAQNQEGLRIKSAGGAPQVGFYGATPVSRPLLATGAGHTVDDVITVLQALGLVRQA